MFKRYFKFCLPLVILVTLNACKKGSTLTEKPQDAQLSFTVDGAYNGTLSYNNVAVRPKISTDFSQQIGANSISKITWKTNAGQEVAFQSGFSNNNKTLTLTPTKDLASFEKYLVVIPSDLMTQNGGEISNPIQIQLQTGLDGKDKFPQISDDDLLTLIQKQTFKYFWDFAHPASGMARERNTSGDVVTTGGSGFGIMSIVVGINRNFISKADGLARLQKIVGFLKTADTFHGVFPHWLNGNTGKVIPFSTKDNGADLVETSFLMQGLIVARQYFAENSPQENQLRADINTLSSRVEWDWFRQGDQQKLFWHWSPDYNWDINLQVKGWNESLMVYVLAASSGTHGIPKSVYDNGWADNGGMKNGNTFYGVSLPLGPANGGPLFFEHYSFLSINPMGLKDAYADYQAQTLAHTKINYNYCVANPKKYVGYSKDCWGLTASDINGGYTASSPDNDGGYIAPTAAISSIAYTPTESMAAIRFFYYKLGDKTWGDYGFKDAFSLTDPWFADSYLAIDQGPQIVMIENYRTKLIWNLFMSAPEVKMGMQKLGFTSPNL
ncbi:hypothetical protein ABIB40_002446 [Pedobacter sp. UYP30]|uniref:glucoamylase family protein n=1 Tax=Pedobacter sp. UYP30 TaxID=1756400 RepID=UPI0033921FF6